MTRSVAPSLGLPGLGVVIDLLDDVAATGSGVHLVITDRAEAVRASLDVHCLDGWVCAPLVDPEAGSIDERVYAAEPSPPVLLVTAIDPRREETADLLLRLNGDREWFHRRGRALAVILAGDDGMDADGAYLALQQRAPDLWAMRSRVHRVVESGANPEQQARNTTLDLLTPRFDGDRQAARVWLNGQDLTRLWLEHRLWRRGPRRRAWIESIGDSEPDTTPAADASWLDGLSPAVTLGSEVGEPSESSAVDAGPWDSRPAGNVVHYERWPAPQWPSGRVDASQRIMTDALVAALDLGYRAELFHVPEDDDAAAVNQAAVTAGLLRTEHFDLTLRLDASPGLGPAIAGLLAEAGVADCPHDLDGAARRLNGALGGRRTLLVITDARDHELGSARLLLRGRRIVATVRGWPRSTFAVLTDDVRSATARLAADSLGAWPGGSEQVRVRAAIAALDLRRGAALAERLVLVGDVDVWAMEAHRFPWPRVMVSISGDITRDGDSPGLTDAWVDDARAHAGDPILDPGVPSRLTTPTAGPLATALIEQARRSPDEMASFLERHPVGWRRLFAALLDAEVQAPDLIEPIYDRLLATDLDRRGSAAIGALANARDRRSVLPHALLDAAIQHGTATLAAAIADEVPEHAFTLDGLLAWAIARLQTPDAPIHTACTLGLRRIRALSPHLPATAAAELAAHVVAQTRRWLQDDPKALGPHTDAMTLLAHRLRRCGRARDALDVADEALKHARTLVDLDPAEARRLEIRARRARAMGLLNNGRYARAVAEARDAVERARATGDVSELRRSLQILADVLSQTTAAARMLEPCIESMRLSAAEPDDRSERSAALDLGDEVLLGTAMVANGQPAAALRAYQRARGLLLALEARPRRRADLLLEAERLIGFGLMKAGRHDEARQVLLDVLEKHRAQPGEAPRKQLGHARVLWMLGAIETDVGRPDRGASLVDEALDLLWAGFRAHPPSLAGLVRLVLRTRRHPSLPGSPNLEDRVAEYERLTGETLD